MMIERTKKRGRWEYTVYIVRGLGLAALIGIPTHLHTSNKSNAVEEAKAPLVENVRTLKRENQALENRFETRIDSLDSSHKEEVQRIQDDAETRLETTIGSLEEEYEGKVERAGTDSLNSFFAKHPGFNPNKDYRPSVGYWSSVQSNGARDFGDYEVMKRGIGAIFGERYKEFADDVLSGKAVLISGEEARKRTRDPSVRDGEKYLFVADPNGNPKGYGMNFEQYRRFKHGGK